MNLLRRIFPGEAVVVALVLLPAVVAMPVLLSMHMSSGSLEAANALRIGGKLTGILGLACLLFAGILAVRIPGFDRPFGGLTRLWRLHHMLGSAALLLLMLHPLLLAYAALPEGSAVAASILFPPLHYTAVWIGWAALLAMMIYLAPSYSFFGPPNYQRWKRIHLLAGVALLLGALHAVLLNSVFASAWNIAIWGGLGLFALAAFAWRTVFSKRLARKPYRISAVEPLARGVVELVLESLGKPLAFRAGQFVYLVPRDPALAAGCNEEHPYTISSAPQSRLLRIAIKDLGDASHALQTVTPGSIAHLEGPYGNLFREDVAEPELWLGGGIGMTPFMARARALSLEGVAVDVRLVYCAQDESRAYFLQELRDIAGRIEGFEVIVHYFADEGMFSAEFLSSQVPDHANRASYICGPLPMIRLCKGILRASGTPAHRIRSEEFTLL